jgi:uracil-DNA glycosylase family 4
MVGCPVPNARGSCRPEGTGANGVLLLGEALGETEVMEGLPFRPSGQAGAVLERAIRKIGTLREQYVVWNSVPVQPPHNKLSKTPYESAAIEWGREMLEEVIDRYKPRCILALGAIPTRQTTGMCGDKMSISHLCGYVLPPIKPTYPPVVATYHPAYLRRGAMSHMGVLMRSLRLALRVASGQVKVQVPPILDPPTGYVLHPTLEQAEDFLNQVLDLTFHGGHQPKEGYLAYDIETYYSTDEEEAEEHDAKDIKSIQFSLSPQSGIFMPWREPFISVAKQILSSGSRKVNWNGWRFDDPALRATGCQINGQIIDLMWAWHHWQPDLPRKLQFAAAHMGPRIHEPSHSWAYPWKHISAQNERFYGIVDVDVLQWMVNYQ